MNNLPRVSMCPVVQWPAHLCVALLVLVSLPLHAEEEAPAMDELTVCAVYHRMLAASFRRSRNLPVMADMEQEKMEDLIRRARDAAVSEYGEEMAEEMFLDAWRESLAYMTDQINRNYENVRRLKSRYGNRCRKLATSAP